MAIRAQHKNVLGLVVSPIAVDVLDLKRNRSGKRIALSPAAALATVFRCYNEMTTNSPVEVSSCR
jgi:hypothetical protein